jgi:hypothetical protein
MTCEELQQRFVEALAAGRPPAADAGIAAHLADCPACQARVEDLPDLWATLGRLSAPPPPAGLTERFAHSARSTELPRRARAFRHRLSPLVAAACLVGVVVGAAAMRVVGGSPIDADRASLESEVDLLRGVAARALNDRASPGLRAAAVSAVRRQGVEADAPLLLRVLRTDPSVGVRLAAVTALESLAEEPGVRSGMYGALAEEPSPHVQLALLRVLWGRSVYRDDLARFLTRDDLDPSVRDLAQRMATNLKRKVDL